MQLRWLMRRIMPRALLYSRVRERERWFLYVEHILYVRVCLCKVRGFFPCPLKKPRRFSPIDLRVPLYPSGELSAALKSPFQPASRTSYLHAASINLCPSPSLHVTRPRARKHAPRWETVTSCRLLAGARSLLYIKRYFQLWSHIVA